MRRDRRSPSPAFYGAERETYLLEVSLGQVRQNVGVNFVLAEGRFVLAEAETLSHSPRSMASPHMVSRDNRSVAASCPALRVAGSAGTGSSESHRRMTSVRATNAFGRGRLSSAHRSFIASNLKVALVDLIRSPNHWGMTGICAQQTAGVDVNRA